MHGYHFTTYEVWQKVQEEGLHPALIDDPSIREVSGTEDGIWMYNELLEGSELLGCLIWLMGFKRTDTVCELDVGFLQTDCLQPARGDPTDELRLTYRGAIEGGSLDAEDWVYFKGKRITILRNMVKPAQIKLNRMWALRQAVEVDVFGRANVNRICDVSSIPSGMPDVCSL